MCNICNNQQSKFAMTGLSGKMCTACHDAILSARKGNTEEARTYFNSINIQSDEARQFVANELGENEMSPSTMQFAASTSKSARNGHTSLNPDNELMLNKIANDITTVKNILIFFLIITVIGLGGTFIYVMQIVNTFKNLF